MKQYWLTSALCICMISINFGQNPTFSVSLEKDTILMGTHVELVFTLENIDGRFSPPNLDEFDIISGPNQSTFMQMHAGKIERKTQYTYHLMPKKIGEIVIGSANVTRGQESFQTGSLTLFVKENKDFFKNNPKSIPANKESDTLIKRPIFKI